MDIVGKTKNGTSWFFVNQSGGVSKLILFYVIFYVFCLAS